MDAKQFINQLLINCDLYFPIVADGVQLDIKIVFRYTK